MEHIILSKKALDLMEEVYIKNLPSTLTFKSRADPKGVLERVDASIEIVELIGALSGYFGKFKTDKLKLVIEEEKSMKQLIEEREKEHYGT